jgi:plasmid stability protein
MAKIVNIRNIPTPVYRKLKKRADAAGLSMPQYALRALKHWEEERRVERALARLRRSVK